MALQAEWQAYHSAKKGGKIQNVVSSSDFEIFSPLMHALILAQKFKANIIIDVISMKIGLNFQFQVTLGCPPCFLEFNCAVVLYNSTLQKSS